MKSVTIEADHLPVGMTVRIYGNCGAMTRGVNAFMKKWGKTNRFRGVWNGPATAHCISARMWSPAWGDAPSRYIWTSTLFFYAQNVGPETVAHEAFHAARFFRRKLQEKRLLRPRRNRTPFTRELWFEEWEAVSLEHIISLINAWTENNHKWDQERFARFTPYPTMRP